MLRVALLASSHSLPPAVVDRENGQAWTPTAEASLSVLDTIARMPSVVSTELNVDNCLIRPSVKTLYFELIDSVVWMVVIKLASSKSSNWIWPRLRSTFNSSTGQSPQNQLGSRRVSATLTPAFVVPAAKPGIEIELTMFRFFACSSIRRRRVLRDRHSNRGLNISSMGNLQ